MQKPRNAAYLKQQNRKDILKIIRKQALSRAEIARLTGLSRAAITIITDSLISQSLVIETDVINVLKGRPSIMLEINPDIFYSIGINISRSNCSIGIVDFIGNLRASKIFKISENKDPYKAIDIVCGEVLSLITDNAIDIARVLGCGVTTPGPIDKENGIVLNPPDFNIWHNFPIVAAISDKLNCKVILENNSVARVQAEKNYGTNLSDFILILVDESGIGGGIVINDKVYKGTYGFGSEIGHMSIVHDGRQCNCGNKGCLEKYAAMSEILNGITSWKEVVDRAVFDIDRCCLDIIDKEAEYLATAIINVNNLLELNNVVLSGVIEYKPELLLGKIHEIVSERLISRKNDKFMINVAGLSENANIISSANLSIDELFY